MQDKSAELPKSSKEAKETSESPLTHQRRRLGGVRGRLAGLTIAGLTAYGGLSAFRDVTNSNTHTNSPEPSPIVMQTPKSTPEPAPQPTPESERAKLEQQIEEKYNIQLLNMKEGFERAEREYNEADERSVGDRPPIRWNIGQLKTIDELISYLPPQFYSQIVDRPFALSLMDYGESEEVAGNYHGDHKDMVTFLQDAFNEDGFREGQLSLLVHELTHRLDIGVMHEGLREKVIKMLENKDFLPRLYDMQNNIDPNIDQDFYGGIGTLGSFAPGQAAAEGTAGFAQIYVRGYERFMKAVGPILDGVSWPQDYSRDNIAKTFPRAQAIYDLYKHEVFDGNEYDFLPWNKEINERNRNLNQVTEQTTTTESEQSTNINVSVSEEQEAIREAIRDQIEVIDNYYGISINYDGEKPLNSGELNYLVKILTVFPERFFPKEGDKHWDLIIVDDEDKIQDIKDQNPDALVITRPRAEESYGMFPSDTMKYLGGQIMARYDLGNGNKVGKEIIDLLGGEKALDEPLKNFPELNYSNVAGDAKYQRDAFLSKDAGRIAEVFYTFYVDPALFWGMTDRVLDEVTDDLNSAQTKTARIYNLIKNELMGGQEFLAVDSDGVVYLQ